jgi:hypothetical protein
MGFSLPPGVGPKQYDIGASIDALFNAYAQQKADERQQVAFEQGQQDRSRALALQNIEQTATFGAPASQFTPQDLQAAQQPAPGPGNLGPNMGITPPEPAHVTALRNYLDMKKNALALGAQQAQAGVAKTQAEGQKAGAEARLAQQKADMFGGDAGGFFDSIAQKVKSGEWSPEQAASFVGRNEDAKLALTGAFVRNGVQALPLQSSADAKVAGASSSAKLSEGGDSQQMARSANSAYKQFDLLQKASDNFARTNNQLLNTPLLQIDATKHPEAQVFKTALSTARIEYARAASGSKSPSDTFMAEAKAALPDGITAAQIGPTLDQLRNSLSEQTRGQLTPASIDNAPPLITPAAKGGKTTKPAPAVGTIKGGYKFRGGNPALPASWVKL